MQSYREEFVDAALQEMVRLGIGNIISYRFTETHSEEDTVKKTDLYLVVGGQQNGKAREIAINVKREHGLRNSHERKVRRSATLAGLYTNVLILPVSRQSTLPAVVARITLVACQNPLSKKTKEQWRFIFDWCCDLLKEGRIKTFFYDSVRIAFWVLLPSGQSRIITLEDLPNGPDAIKAAKKLIKKGNDAGYFPYFDGRITADMFSPLGPPRASEPSLPQPDKLIKSLERLVREKIITGYEVDAALVYVTVHVNEHQYQFSLDKALRRSPSAIYQQFRWLVRAFESRWSE